MSRAHSSAHNPATPTAPLPSSSDHPTKRLSASYKEYPPLTTEHLKLKMRLAPLLQVEAALVKKLLPHGHVQLAGLANPAQSLPIQQEICVNSSAGWKNTFSRLIGRESCDSSDLIDWSNPDDPGIILNACSEDMKRLWTDPIIRKLMEIEKMRPEEMAGLYVLEPYSHLSF